MKKLSSTRDTKSKQVPVYINGKRCWLEGDSGTGETIVSKWFWNNILGKPTLQRTTETITDFSGNEVKLMGKLKCDFKMNGRKNRRVGDERTYTERTRPKLDRQGASGVDSETEDQAAVSKRRRKGVVWCSKAWCFLHW
uniref:Uncharacterized protein n=1 Tax=Acrobeloides nanus TaxID=290746 RepID=A0A914ED99_9BILA